MYRVLVMGLASTYGGIESVIKNYYDNFDYHKIHLDFICNFPQKMAYEDYFIKKYQSKVFHTIRRGKNPIKYLKQLNWIFNEYADNYDCLWFNTSDLANIDGLKLAKKYRIKRVIIHSHNSKMIDLGLKGKIKTVQHEIHKKRIYSYATDFWTCSKVAGKWLYPEELQNKVKIIKNAINLNKIEFDLQKRNSIRNKYNFGTDVVIGNIGRLNFQKNQSFIIDIYNELIKLVPDSKLVFVGAGEDYELLKRKVDDLNLTNNVIFAGLQRDMKAWYSALDLFLFPSLFEGLSLALLEAQANGIPILTSNTVSPQEVKINNNFYVKNLNSDAKSWANEIINILNKSGRLDKKIIYKNFDFYGYEIQEAAKTLQNMFLEKN